MPFIKGEFAYIQEIQGDYAYIETLHLNSDLGGFGTVPLSCLKICTDPKWIAAKDKRLGIYTEYEKDIKAYYVALIKAKKAVAEETGLSIEEVNEVINLWDKKKPLAYS